jgi:hypothetical protein
MRKIYFSALLLGLACTMPVNAKLDLGSRTMLRQHRLEQIQKSKTSQGDETVSKLRKKLGVPGDYVLAAAILADGETADELIAEGANVYYQRKNIVFMSVPTSDVERLSELKSVRRMELARKLTPKLSDARVAAGVAKIHAGEDLTQAYTGKGVMAGIVDGGMDPNHINFRNADGTSRIGMLANATVSTTTGDIKTTFYGDDVVGAAGPISAFTTDDNTTFHGVHTMGIMAGSYMGDATVAVKKNFSQSENQTMANPYYGVAYEADIAATCGDLYDQVIAYGVALALDYADYKGEPCVINLSLGSNTGAHDPNSTMGQVLESLGQDGIICVSAGNEGDLPIAITKTFSSDDLVLKSCINPYYFSSSYNYLRYGQVYTYSADSTEFKIQAVIINRSRGTVVFRSQEFGNQEGGAQYYVSSDSYQESDDDIIDSTFARYFDGYIGVGTEYDDATGRYMACLDYYTMNTSKYNSKDNYVIAFIITGVDGQRVDCYCDGTYTCLDNYDLAGYTAGSTNGTISDLACANNILVVGSYNTSDDYATLNGGIMGYQGEFTPGGVSGFSSYGTILDGRNLPHVLAPGACIISSTSKYYVDNSDNGMTEDYLSAKVSEDSRDNYWQVAIGTSMSSPFVAGSIALWLEADPTLTINNIYEIIENTAIKDEDTAKADPVQIGYGKFDAYEGLKYVLRHQAGVSDIKADENRLMITSNGDKSYNIFLNGESAIKATLYNLQGQIVANQSANGDELTFNAAGVTPGIYILNVNGNHSQRIIVK